MFTSLIIAVALALAGCLTLALLARGPGNEPIPAVADAGPELPAALVSFVLSGCAPGAEAYQATILDLAGRGRLAASTGPEGLRVAVADTPAVQAAGAPPGRPGLTGYEQQVLGDATTRMSGTGGAPIEVVADACRVDVNDIWNPFEADLRADARQRGLSRPVLPVTAQTVAAALAVATGIAAAAFLIARLVAVASNPQAGFGGPATVAGIALLVCLCVLRWLTKRDRLTALGSALADQCRRDRASLAADAAAHRQFGWIALDPAGLRRAALATAAGIARASGVPGAPSAPGRRRRRVRGLTRRPNATQRPAGAWSSFSGTWRRVEINMTAGPGLGRGFALLFGAAWAGVLAYAAAVFGGIGPLPVILACAAAGLAAAAARLLARLSAMPRSTTFTGHVIARWQEDDNSESGSGRLYYIAVDDAQRAWTFGGEASYNRVALGDVVRVTASPRSWRLIELSVTARRGQRGDGAEPWPGVAPPGVPPSGVAAPRVPAAGVAAAREMAAGAGAWAGLGGAQGAARMAVESLVTATEAAALVGPLGHSKPFPGPAGHSMIIKGRDGTLSLVVTDGGIASFSAMIGRRAGTKVPGIGDEAWLLNRGRTVLARVGPQCLKLTVTNLGGRGAERLPVLAAVVAGRLASQQAGPAWPRPGAQPA